MPTNHGTITYNIQHPNLVECNGLPLNNTLKNIYKTKNSNSWVGRQNYLTFTGCTEFSFDNRLTSFFVDVSIFIPKLAFPFQFDNQKKNPPPLRIVLETWMLTLICVISTCNLLIHKQHTSHKSFR